MLVTIIADASFCPETSVAGYGFWIACNRGKLQGSGEMKLMCRDNIAAEMQAVVNAVHRAVKKNLVLKHDEILIQTDCQAAIDRFKEHPNRLHQEYFDCWRRLERLKVDHNLRVQYRHVKGHTNNSEPRFKANNLCDRLARKAMREARDKIKLLNGEEL